MVAANRNIYFQVIRDATLKKDRQDLAKMASLVGPQEENRDVAPGRGFSYICGNMANLQRVAPSPIPVVDRKGSNRGPRMGESEAESGEVGTSALNARNYSTTPPWSFGPAGGGEGFYVQRPRRQRSSAVSCSLAGGFTPAGIWRLVGNLIDGGNRRQPRRSGRR